MNKIIEFLFGKRAFQYSEFMEYDQIGPRYPQMGECWSILYRSDMHIFVPSKGDLYFGFGPLFKNKKDCQQAIDKIGRKNLFIIFYP